MLTFNVMEGLLWAKNVNQEAMISVTRSWIKKVAKLFKSCTKSNNCSFY